MRNEKTGNQDYKMVSVPGKQGSTLDGMSAARLRQELEALRESEVGHLWQSTLHGRRFYACCPLPALTTPAGIVIDPRVPCAEVDRAAFRRAKERGETKDQQAERLVWKMRQPLATEPLLSINCAVPISKLTVYI
jgi:hypothetical protein